VRKNLFLNFCRACLILSLGFFFSCATKKKSTDFVLKNLGENRNGISAEIVFPVFRDFPDLNRTVEAFVAYDYDSFKKDVQEKNAGLKNDGVLSEYKLLGEPRVNGEYIFVEINVFKKMCDGSDGTRERKIFLYRISDGAFLSADEIDSLPDFQN